MLKRNCFYCHETSDLYLESANNDKNKKFNFASSELYTENTELKPNLFYCKNCEIIFSELCDKNFEKNYVDVYDPLYVDQIENKKHYFNNLINKISHKIKLSDDVLEIGSYYGAFGSQIRKKVKDYKGIELSPNACSFAKKNFDLDIENINIFDFFKKNDKKYDVIFMFDVIEHLDNPDLVLDLCSKNLKTDGRLIISTMNMNSLFAKITGKYYQWIIAMHKFYFTDKSMTKFLDKNNLQLDKILNDVRIISLEYFFLKISQKIPLLRFIYLIVKKIKFLKNLKIKLSFFDINIYCASLKK